MSSNPEMSRNPDQVYYDDILDSAKDEKSETQDVPLEYEYSNNAAAVYFELEDNNSSELQHNAIKNASDEDEESLAEKKNYKTNEDGNMKKVNTVIKTTVLSLASKFDGKKRAEDHDLRGKTEQKKPAVLPTFDKPRNMTINQQLTKPNQDQELATHLRDYSLQQTAGGAQPQDTVTTTKRTASSESYGVTYDSPATYDSYPTRAESSSAIYELAQPVVPEPKKSDTLRSTTSSIAPSVNKGCLEGAGQAVPVDFINPHQKTSKDNRSTDYERLYFKSVDAVPRHNENVRALLKKKGYGSLASIRSEIAGDKSFVQLEDEDFDPNAESQSENDSDSNYWGSEFDETSLQYFDPTPEAGGYNKSEAPDKPLPPVPVRRPFMSRTKSVPSDISALDDPLSTACLPVIINPEKHPPPLLPPQPSGLTQNQIKRRMIIESIINSERSYLESLERLIKDYEKTVLEYISQPKSSVRRVFAEMKEIISHHKMFQIELSVRVKRWDSDEKIGDIFTASFSKTMLVNAYSTYVNNFAAAMEEIRTLQRSRQSFLDFLQKQEKLSHDRLSIFGLMVKPVQRFPQFIMFLQDLIKYTPHNHEDRRALQLALTELENVAYRLNERKRQSEQIFQASQTIQQLIKQKVQHVLTTWNFDVDSNRRLIRTDSVEQVFGEVENMKCKNRRLILMNDLVLCVKVIEKEQSGYIVERLVLRWMAKVKDLQLKDTVITPDMLSIVKREPGKIHIISPQPEKPEDDPFHLFADLHEMVHDHTVLAQITALLSTLKRSYAGHGLREELVHEVSRDLQHMIQIKEEQLRLVNSCSIILQDNSRSDKQHYVLQTQTPAVKQDWCIDFLMAKLALERSNNLAWDGSTGSDGNDFDVIPAHFMKHLPVDVPKNYTKIRCAVSIFLNPEKSAFGIGVQHLWVCSSIPTHGQVSVLSIHNSKPALMESFRACSSDILAVELVPGCGETMKAESYMFPEDTVWLTAAHREILIFPLASQDSVHRQPLAILRTPAVTVSLKFVDERLFCGFDDGAVSVYSRKEDGSWNVSDPTLLTFGTSPVKLHFVHEENIWLSCANKLFQLEIDSLQIQDTFTVHTNHMSSIDQIVKSGVGIWVSFHESSIIKLFHIETMENLQEISVGNFVNRIRAEKLWSINGNVEDLVVTCLGVSRGLLWVGTSIGIVLTVPLPRLSDGVPLYRGHPKVSLHAHRGPVRFLIPMNCSSNTLELNKASSLRSALRARQSRRNVEREKLELEESEKRKSRVKDAESVRSAEDLGSKAKAINSNNTSSSSSLSREVSITKEADVMFSDIASLDNKINQKSAKKNSSLDHRKSKTLSFRTELAQRIMVKSNTLSRSSIDLTSLEPLEVQELYEILLEDDANMEEGNRDIEVSSEEMESSGKAGKRSENVQALISSKSGSSLATPSWLNAPSTERNQNDNGNIKSVAVQQLPVSSSPDSAAVNTSSSNRSKITDSMSTVRPLVRGGTFKMTSSRKASCNAVIVLSGGDGYCDLDLSRNQSRTDDACVLLWVHKF